MYNLHLLTVAVLALSTTARRLHRRECEFTWPATTADTCATMAADWAITEALFRAINPGVECSRSLVEGQEYCVGWIGTPPSVPTPSTTVTPKPTSTSSRTTLVTSTSTAPPSGPAPPSPVQSGITQNCNKYYLVAGGDTCQKIVDIYKTFTLQQFYAWNPAVGTTCATLWPQYYVCVGAPGSPTPSSTARPQPTGPAPLCSWNAAKGQYECPGNYPPAPGPVQAGIPSNCNKWVLQKNGVYCYDMAIAAGITLDRLYALNPALGSSCGGLWVGYAYCLETGIRSQS